MTDVVLQSTGEIVDPADAEEIVAAYQAVQAVERKCQDDRARLAEAFRKHHALPVLANTVHTQTGKVVVEGGPSISVGALRSSLLTLARSGESPVTEEQVERAFTQRSPQYGIRKASWDKFLELGGDKVRELVSLATNEDAPYRLKIVRAGDDGA